MQGPLPSEGAVASGPELECSDRRFVVTSASRSGLQCEIYMYAYLVCMLKFILVMMLICALVM